MMRKRRAADLFAGAGGFSAGAERAGLEVVFALNHNVHAIETHKANHPAARHACMSIETASPGDCDAIDVLLASPSCRQHSIGNVKPIEEQDRAHAWDIVRWIDWHHPADLVVENVKQFKDWGPIGKDRRPLNDQRGKFFELWLSAIRSIGYTLEWHILNAADFGAPTSRERFILMGKRGKRSPVFPEPTHGPGRLPHQPCRPCLDLSVKGNPIGNRLCDATMRRIEHGRNRYGSSPFLIKYFKTGISASIDAPISTLTTKHRHGLVIKDTLRMLTNTEMAKCQGYAEDYIFCGSPAEVTKQIGNSVPPPMSRAVCSMIAG